MPRSRAKSIAEPARAAGQSRRQRGGRRQLERCALARRAVRRRAGSTGATRMKHGYKVSWRVAFATPAALALMASVAPLESQSPTTPRPRYAANGDLLLPVGFENWVFVGSNLGLGYEAEPPSGEPQYHNIYINPEAYAHFLA